MIEKYTFFSQRVVTVGTIPFSTQLKRKMNNQHKYHIRLISPSYSQHIFNK